MADQPPAEEDLGRLPSDEELTRLQRTTVRGNGGPKQLGGKWGGDGRMPGRARH